MLCFNARKKLYALTEGDLSGSSAEELKVHLDSCAKCAEEYGRIKQVLELASKKEAPKMPPEFWAEFDRDLREKLVREKETPDTFTIRPERTKINLKPVYALAAMAMFLISVSFYLFGGVPTKSRLNAASDERLVNDLLAIEELTEEAMIFDDQDILLDEIFLLEEVNGSNGSA
ncbi:MAG: zf-HC2 domain-containing protein [Candidatus Omnitrophica bacterium]|nr:zf-HC2 domain-containing protein [Candidatus Omnitrophota bacterium]